MVSVDNQKLLRPSGRSFPVDLQVSYESSWGPSTQTIEKLFDLTTRSFHLRLDSTIRKISNPAAETQVQRSFLSESPIADTLYPSGYHDLNRNNLLGFGLFHSRNYNHGTRKSKADWVHRKTGCLGGRRVRWERRPSWPTPLKGRPARASSFVRNN